MILSFAALLTGGGTVTVGVRDISEGGLFFYLLAVGGTYFLIYFLLSCICFSLILPLKVTSSSWGRAIFSNVCLGTVLLD